MGNLTTSRKHLTDVRCFLDVVRNQEYKDHSSVLPEPKHFFPLIITQLGDQLPSLLVYRSNLTSKCNLLKFVALRKHRHFSRKKLALRVLLHSSYIHLVSTTTPSTDRACFHHSRKRLPLLSTLHQTSSAVLALSFLTIPAAGLDQTQTN